VFCGSNMGRRAEYREAAEFGAVRLAGEEERKSHSSYRTVQSHDMLSSLSRDKLESMS